MPIGLLHVASVFIDTITVGQSQLIKNNYHLNVGPQPHIRQTTELLFAWRRIEAENGDDGGWQFTSGRYAFAIDFSAIQDRTKNI